MTLCLCDAVSLKVAKMHRVMGFANVRAGEPMGAQCAFSLVRGDRPYYIYRMYLYRRDANPEVVHNDTRGTNARAKPFIQDGPRHWIGRCGDRNVFWHHQRRNLVLAQRQTAP